MKRIRRISVRTIVLMLILLFLAISTTVSGQPASTTRDDIVASREKRKLQLEGVLQNIQKKVEEHRSGKKRLEQHQLDHFEHKISSYMHQIEELDRELDEEEIQHRIQKAEEIRRSKLHREL